VHGLAFVAGELCVRYVRPTPIGVPLTIRAVITRREGRRVFTEATVQHDGEIVAEATCIKVTLPKST
jgi:predicted thioesterase